MNKAKWLTVIAGMLVTDIVAAQGTEIEKYCSDMKAARGESPSWYQSCVGTLEVQEKYKKKAELSSRTAWFLKVADVYKALSKIKDPVEREAFYQREGKQLVENDCRSHDCAALYKEMRELVRTGGPKIEAENKAAEEKAASDGKVWLQKLTTLGTRLSKIDSVKEREILFSLEGKQLLENDCGGHTSNLCPEATAEMLLTVQTGVDVINTTDTATRKRLLGEAWLRGLSDFNSKLSTTKNLSQRQALFEQEGKQLFEKDCGGYAGVMCPMALKAILETIKTGKAVPDLGGTHKK